MKRVIRAATSDSIKHIHEPVQHGSIRYMANIYEDFDRGFISGQLVKIAPYDDAEYVWAKIENNGVVKFIQDGKIIDKEYLFQYDDEYYEGMGDYFDDVIDQLILDLEEYNRKIKPRMMYN